MGWLWRRSEMSQHSEIPETVLDTKDIDIENKSINKSSYCRYSAPLPSIPFASLSSHSPPDTISPEIDEKWPSLQITRVDENINGSRDKGLKAEERKRTDEGTKTEYGKKIEEGRTTEEGKNISQSNLAIHTRGGMGRHLGVFSTISLMYVESK